MVDLGVAVPAVGSGNESSGGLIFLLRPGTDFELGRKRRRSLRMRADIEIHEDARMAAEALLQEGARDFSCVVRQQLRLHAMNAGRLLQGLDNVRGQSPFDLMPVGTSTAVADENVAHNTLL